MLNGLNKGLYTKNLINNYNTIKQVINVAEELIRHANKVIISKIIKTDNKLSGELAQQYIDAVKKTNPYSENINSENNKKITVT